MAETIGQAYIEIIPSADGVSSKIEKEMSGAGSKSGVAFSAAFGGAAGVAMSKALSGVEAIGGAVVDFAKESVQTGNEFDSAMSQVAATAGKTMEQLNSEVVETDTAFGHFQGNLTDFAQFMGSNTAFSAKQAAEALNYMALAGYDAQTSVEMLPNVLSLAAAGAIDLGEASDMVTDVSSALNLSLDETATMVDQMAAAAASSNTSVAQLGAAMLKIGGTAANLKGGTQELSTALGILANNGIKSAEGGTHLRNMLLSLENVTTDKAKGALHELGLEEKFAYDEAGNLRGVNEIFTDLNNAMAGMTNAEIDSTLAAIFNKTDLSAVRAMLAGMSTSFNDLNGALKNSGVNWDQYVEKTGDLEARIENLASQIAYNISQGFSNEEIADFIDNEYDIHNMEDTLKMVEAARAAVNAEGGAWDDLYGKIGDAEGAAQQMADTQLDNLTGQLTLMDSALEGAKIAIAGEFTPALTDMVKLGTKGISELTTSFQQGGFEGFLDKMSELIPQAGQMIIDKLPEFTEKGMQMMQALVEGALQMAPYLTEAFMKALTSLVEMEAEWAPKLYPMMAEAVTGMISVFVDNLPALVSAAGEMWAAVGEGVSAAMPIILTTVPEIITDITNVMVQALETQQGTLIQIFQTIADAIIACAPLLMPAAMKLIEAFGTYFIQYLPQLMLTGTELVIALISGMSEGALEHASEMASALIEPLTSAFENAGGLSGIGSSIIEKLFSGADGLSGGALSGVFNSVATEWENLQGRISLATFGLQMQLTSVKMSLLEVANNLTQIWQAVIAKLSPLLDALRYLFDTVFTAAQILVERAMTAIHDEIVRRWEEIKAFWEPVLTAISEKVTTAFDAIKTSIDTKLNEVKTLFITVWEAITVYVSEKFELIKNTVLTKFNELKELLAGPLDQVKQTFNKFVDEVAGFFDKVIKNAITWGKDLMGNFISGIDSKIGDLSASITNIADKIREIIGFSEPESGPLSNFHTYAPDMMELFARGIKENEAVVASQMQKSFNLGNAIMQNGVASDAARSLAYEAPVAVSSDNSELSGQFAQAVTLLGQLVDKDPVEIGANAAGIFDLVRKQNNMYLRANGRGALA